MESQRSRRWRLALSAQTALVQASWTGVRLMIGYRALALGADPLILGALATAFALPALVAALPAGRWSDRSGGPVVAIAGIATALVGTVSACVAPNVALLVAAAGVIGLGQITVMIGQQTLVAHASTGTSTDQAFGVLTAAASVGQLIGPPVVTLVASALAGGSAAPDTMAGMLTCAIFLVLAMPVHVALRAWNGAHAHRSAAEATTSAAALLKTPQMWRSLIVSGAVLVSLDLMYAFIPVWATERGIGAAAVGLLLALRAAVTVVSRIGLARLVRRFGRRVLITASIGAAVAGLIALPFVGL